MHMELRDISVKTCNSMYRSIFMIPSPSLLKIPLVPDLCVLALVVSVSALVCVLVLE